MSYLDNVDEKDGISLYLQGTLLTMPRNWVQERYIPVPTGNSVYYLK